MALATHVSSLASKSCICTRWSWGKEQKPTDLGMQTRAEQGKQRQAESSSWESYPSLSPSLFIASSMPGTCVSCPDLSLPLGVGLL